MALQMKTKKVIKPLLQSLYNDLAMLKDGTWVPDKHSCEASMDGVLEVAKELGIEVEDVEKP